MNCVTIIAQQTEQYLLSNMSHSLLYMIVIIIGFYQGGILKIIIS